MDTRRARSATHSTQPVVAVDPTLVRDEEHAPRAATPEPAMHVEDRRARPTRRAPYAGPVVLDRYRLHRRLGAGGFGTVWQARDERLDRDVAVKLLPRERIVGGRFEREARAAARLSHPGIVTLYEAAVDDDGAYLVSELVRGATLGALLESGRLSDRDVVKIGVALGDALAHAHAQQVVHRDVKPSNVLVPEHPTTAAQVAKLTDFGVARIIGGDTLTRTGDVVGTMAYMAPEQAEGLEAGAPADLYSLALVLYEALTGINPIGTGTAARRARRLGAYLPPLRRQRRDLPRELGCAVDLALRPRPRERGSVEELRGALAASAGEVEDRPGVVESPWPARRVASRFDQLPDPDPGPVPAAGADDDRPRPVGHAFRRPVPWPDRVLAATVAAGVAAWIAGVVLAPSAVNPAVAAVAAAVAVGALPRIGWAALIAAGAGILATQGRPGAALVVALAGVAPAVLMILRPASWPLGAITPALGAVGIAGAWPALAGRAPGPWHRAALGAAGWLSLIAVELLAGSNLYVHLPGTVAPASAWTSSLDATLQHALGPLTSSGALAPAAVWALAALVLPWVTVIRPLAVTAVLVTTWTAATASATTTVLHMAHGGAVVKPQVAVAGAVVAAVVALAPAVLGALVPRRWPEGTRVA